MYWHNGQDRDLQSNEGNRMNGNRMNRDIKGRLHIATVCAEYEEILDRYGIGVELDQFCIVENMEGERLLAADAEIRHLLGAFQESAGETGAQPAKAPKTEIQLAGARMTEVHSEDRRSTGTCSINRRPAILHAPFNELYPAAIDPRARALAMERLQRAADLAVHYGVKKMVVHSGYVPLVYFKEWHEDRSVEFWEELMAGREDGLQITVENVMDDEPYMMAQMMERIKNPNIRLCFDVGHAACVSKVPVSEWLDVLAPYLGHLHIHNNNGTHDYHEPIFDGVVDMEVFLDDVLRKCREDTTFTIESLSGLSSMEWLREKGFLSCGIGSSKLGWEQNGK